MLKYALTANAAFSSMSAITMFTIPSWLSTQIPLSTTEWLPIGLILALFAIQLIIMTKHSLLAEKLTMPVVIGDILWVIITTVIMVIYFAQFSAVGIGLVILVNLAVGTFAYFQYEGYRQEIAIRIDRP